MIKIDRPPRPVVFLAEIYGNSPSETWVHKPIFLTSGLTPFRLLFWSFRVGAHEGQLAARDCWRRAGCCCFTKVHWR